MNVVYNSYTCTMVVHLYLEIIHSLKLVDYLHVQVNKSWYSHYVYYALFRVLGQMFCSHLQNPEFRHNLKQLSPIQSFIEKANVKMQIHSFWPT